MTVFYTERAKQDVGLAFLWYKKFRRALLRKFPFSVFYTIEKDDIILHAVFDNRQSPLKHP